MNKLEDLKDCIERQYINLEKSKYRPRSKEEIVTKRSLIQDFFKEFEDILGEFENKVSAQTWNKLTVDYEFVKTRVERALQILDGSSVLPDRRKRRNCDYVIEIVIPEYNSDNLLKENNFILSSTFLDGSHSQAADTSVSEQLTKFKSQFLPFSIERI